MRRTNSKETRKEVRNYIMEGFNPEDYGYDKYLSVDKTNEKEVATAILNCLFEEKIKHDMRKNRISQYDYFEEWVSGLCNMIDSSYYYNVSAIDLLGKWLDETEEEKERYTEDQAEKMITKLLYNELLAMAK